MQSRGRISYLRQILQCIFLHNYVLPVSVLLLITADARRTTKVALLSDYFFIALIAQLIILVER